MKLQNLNQDIAFQKRLVARAGYKKNGKSEICRIYQLEREFDMDYFDYAARGSWKNSYYFYNMKGEWVCGNLDDEVFYTLEDSRGDCLAVGIVNEHNKKDYDTLAFVEVIPCYAKENQYRKTKYIGETFLATMCALAQYRGKDLFTISSPLISAYDFYTEKCKFKPDSDLELYMQEEDFYDFYNQNEKHTGKNIELVI